MLAAVMQETLPDAAELVTPPHRSSSVGDSLSTGTTAAAPTTAGSGSQGLAQPRPPYTLREGVGMRRLVKFRVAAGVQLLLVQAASEMYAQQYMHLGVSVRNPRQSFVPVQHGSHLQTSTYLCSSTVPEFACLPARAM